MYHVSNTGFIGTTYLTCAALARKPYPHMHAVSNEVSLGRCFIGFLIGFPVYSCSFLTPIMVIQNSLYISMLFNHMSQQY